MKNSCTHSNLEHESKRLKSRNAKTQDHIHYLKNSNASLTLELQACKDDLFSLQPVAEVTDAEIIHQFENICEQVSSWVDGEISLFQGRAGGSSAELRMFQCEEIPEIAAMLERISQTGEYLVEASVHRELQEGLLGNHIYLFGLSSDTISLLQAAEDKMKTLDPPRGTSTYL